MAPERFSAGASQISAISLCVSLLGNGSVNTFPRQPIHAIIEEVLDAFFSVRFVSYQKSACSPIVARQRHGKHDPT
jgi:hypothetical protein